LKIVIFKLTASRVVQREIIYPITNHDKIKYKNLILLLVADLALFKKAWKKNDIPT
jgi:hypothetical protein